jgi:hypothetical protein
MRPPVKLVPAASAALIAGALISVGVAFVTGDLSVPAPQLAQGLLKTGEEAPRITRERQQVDSDVVAVVAPPSGAQQQPSSSIPGTVNPPSSTAIEGSLSPELPAPIERSASTDVPSPVERSESPRPVEPSVLPELSKAVENNPVVEVSYLFAARRQGHFLFVEGYVPDEQTGQELMAFARERFFDVAVINQARLHDGAPMGFSAGARFALEQLSFLASGEALLRGKSIWLSGETHYSQAGQHTCSKIASLAPHGWTGTASINWRQEKADENAFSVCQSAPMMGPKG